jgi:shikimate dehydrogenase
MSNQLVSPIPAPPRAGCVDFVSGRTRLYGIVGHPIGQARSPATVTYELRRRGQDAVLVPLDIAPADFDTVLPQLMKLGNLDGLVVTVPHKGRVAAHVKRVGPMAAVCRAASVLARCRDDQWVAEMFDGVGCVTAIENRRVCVAGRRVQLLGAGGAGSAIAAELARKGVGALRIVEPNAARGEDLVRSLRETYGEIQVSLGTSNLHDIDILINASPIGMLDEHASPLGDVTIPSQVVVMDAIMDPERTKLLRTAEASGCVCVYGREMLDSQISRACDFLLRAREQAATEFVFHPD